MISILITTQKYSYVPTVIRSNITILFAFKLNNIDWKKIKEEIVFDDNVFDSVINYVFNTPPIEDAFLVYRIDTNIYFKKFDQIMI